MSIKLSQLPNNSSSSLFINNRTRQPNSPSVNSQRGIVNHQAKFTFSTRDEPIKENLKPSSESSSASTHSLESPITPLIRKLNHHHNRYKTNNRKVHRHQWFHLGFNYTTRIIRLSASTISSFITSVSINIWS